MKNSKGQTLEQPYLDLAMMRREQQEGSEYRKVQDFYYKKTGEVFFAFNWVDTPEKYEFWDEIYYIHLSPTIPASSMKELEEWRKANGIPVENENSDDMCFHECPNCNDRCYCSAQPCSCCTQDEPDYKAMYEEAVKERDYYRTVYERYWTTEQSSDRNWVAECAMAAMQVFIASYAGATKDPEPENVAKKSFDYAEAMIAEGKKRGHI